jgi:hypothetical protein
MRGLTEIEKSFNGSFFLFCFQKSPATIVANLRLCSVRKSDIIDRRFCFEIISPLK